MNSQLTFNQTINEIDKERKTISVLAEELNSENINNNPSIIKSIFPVCEECKENIPFEIYEHKIRFLCKNGHLNLLTLNEYEEYQKANAKVINLEEGNDKINKCSSCENELCVLCSYKKSKKNNIINNELINFICEKHNDVFISYCKQCKKNLCMKCVNQHKSNKNHKNHDIIHYFEILPEKTNLKKKIKEFQK